LGFPELSYPWKFLVEEYGWLLLLGLVPLNEDLAHAESRHDAAYRLLQYVA
jgi:hypothetical protein